MKFAKFLRTPILKNICERLLLFVSPQNTITNIDGKFGLDETSTECNASTFLKEAISFNQIQPYKFIRNLKKVSLSFFQSTFLLNF